MLRSDPPWTASWRAPPPQSSGCALRFPCDLFEERDQRDLARREPFARARALEALQRVAGVILDRVDQRWVDIGLAAHRDGVAQGFSDRLNHGVDADPRIV